VLAAWLGGWRVPSARGGRAAAALASVPFTWLALGWIGVGGLGALSGGRLAPPGHMDAPAAMTEGRSQAEIDCLDPASAALLASVPDGLVLAPVFYGPSVLVLSPHAAVAAPYHRAAAAVLDAFDAFNLPPERGREIAAARGADYVAFCASAKETAIAAGEAPDGLLARLARGETIPWLTPIAPAGDTTLRLYRVAEARRV
jgi:hypothetical protein